MTGAIGAPLPPVLRKSVQQHDRFALADGGEVSMQCRASRRRDGRSRRASGSGGDQAEASTERVMRGSGVGMATSFVRWSTMFIVDLL